LKAGGVTVGRGGYWAVAAVGVVDAGIDGDGVTDLQPTMRIAAPNVSA
jgi:hypothetical protein